MNIQMPPSNVWNQLDRTGSHEHDSRKKVQQHESVGGRHIGTIQARVHHVPCLLLLCMINRKDRCLLDIMSSSEETKETSSDLQGDGHGQQAK
jgi:hypothetical protein